MRRILRDQSLTLIMLGLFLAFLSAQALTGYRVYNADRVEMNEPEIAFSRYLRSGHFVEATFENWESEFLQMGAYVLLTAFLIQRGSADRAIRMCPKTRIRKRAGYPIPPGRYAKAVSGSSSTRIRCRSRS